MENRNSFLLCFISLGIFLLLLTHANAEDRIYPWKNANRSPFQQWRSAYFCLQNKTNSCPPMYTLTLAGGLVVRDTEIQDYCDGCYLQTQIVIHCIQMVHRHFKFGTGQPLAYVRDAINTACVDNTSLNTNHTLHNSATSLYGRLYVPLVSTITTMALIASFT